MKVDIKILDERLKDNLPAYATTGSAGVDLRACIDESFVLEPNHVRLIPTGIAIHLESTHVMAMLHPRSGLGHKNGVVLGNLCGIDCPCFANLRSVRSAA